MRAHLDTVTAVFRNPTLKYTVSGSEDCMLKVWKPSKDQVVTPEYTLRGHSRPVLSITGSSERTTASHTNMIYSGDSNGQIIAWKLYDQRIDQQEESIANFPV